MTVTTAPARTMTQYAERDDYGRRVVATNLHYPYEALCVRVTLPKVYREKYGHAYLVNERGTGTPVEEHVRYFATLREAKAHEAQIIARRKD